VFALPGSRRNAAAAGTNALIADGALPLLDWSDVTLALGMSPGAVRAAGTPVDRPAPGPDGARVLRALAGEPATPDQLVSRTGLDPGALALVVTELARSGWILRHEGLVWPR
jgi:DNA processing protein